MTFTPLDLTAAGALAAYYLIKWLRGRQERLEEEIDDSFYNLDLCKKPKVVAQTPQGTFYNRLMNPGQDQYQQLGMFGSAAQAQQESQIQRILSGQEKLYPGKMIFIDPAVEIYDEAYWRKWKAKHKHEEDRR